MLSSNESDVRTDYNAVLGNNASSSKFGQNTVFGKVNKLSIKLDGFSCLSL